MVNRRANKKPAAKSIGLSDPRIPSSLAKHLAKHAPKSIAALGNLDVLREKKLAFFCSVQCPGDRILKTYDLARRLRGAGVTVVSGFHSPMEKECLRLLLRGKQPVIICLAKRLVPGGLPKEYRQPLRDGRLLVLSPFGDKVKRVTGEAARLRNLFAAALADQVFVAHAAPGGKTEAFCRRVSKWGKQVLTFDTLPDDALFCSGARP